MRVRWILMLIVGMMLAGCSFGSDKKEPTPVQTPLAWATTRPTIVITATLLPSVTPAPTLTPIPTETTQPIATTQRSRLRSRCCRRPTSTPFSLPSKTPLPTLTPEEAVVQPPTFTPEQIVVQPPTITPLVPTTGAVIVITATFAPTLTPVLQPVVTVAPTIDSGGNYGPPPTFTPAIAPVTQIAYAPPSALVCATCDQLRLRDVPGSGGNVSAYLAANAPLTIIGRTGDNVWVQVVTGDGLSGWVAAQFLVINIDLNVVSVTGSAVDAPTAVGGSLVTVDVVTGVSSHARQIFLDGLAKGNLAHVFTRVGDSITASPNFLTQIGSGNYSLGGYNYLGAAIGFFAGPNGRGLNPFAATSIAARNGWGTTSVLDPANSDPGLCRYGETPLECEYRIVRPSVAIIMFGTNDSGGLPTETFRANLGAIVQKSINMGVIPVLSTIPPKHYDARTDARVDEFNAVIVATARSYDIPLINYWQAMRTTSGEGLASDGVHPSIPPDGITTIFDSTHLNYGYTVRNLTTLQALYLLWQYVLYDADTVAIPAATLPPGSNTGTTGGAAYECAGALPPQLTVGGMGRVTPGLPNKVRSEPASGAGQIGAIPGEGVFNVIGGPRCADGYTWWQVDYNGLMGWTAQGDGAEYWVEPY